MNEAMVASDTITRTDFDRLLGDARPRLHRYAARMTGSVIDGEDVVQNAILKALEAFASNGPIRNPESWLIRITHNAAIDLLRQRGRHEAIKSNDDPDMVIDPVTAVMDREVVAASIRTFMRLPVAQRSAVILMDVLGYKLDEISAITDMTVGAIKAALRRGRSRLRELVGETEETGSAPVCPDRLRIEAYIDRFNARVSIVSATCWRRTSGSISSTDSGPRAETMSANIYTDTLCPQTGIALWDSLRAARRLSCATRPIL